MPAVSVKKELKRLWLGRAFQTNPDHQWHSPRVETQAGEWILNGIGLWPRQKC